MRNNHKSNQSNKNNGTPGYNNDYQKMLNNRSNQLNPNNSNYQQKNK